MADKKIIKRSSLNELFSRILKQGKVILGPVEKNGKVLFENIATIEETVKDYVQTAMSAKSTVFPSYEKILSYKYEGKDVKIDDNIKNHLPTVLFGIRPCDARSFKTLDAVFMWDYIDAFYKSRMDDLAIISVSCVKSDAYCFCTSVGGSPGDTEGSDILLTPVENDSFLAEILTEKGEKIAALAPELFTDAADVDKNKYLADVKKYFEVQDIIEKMPGLFETDIWLSQSLRCIGCGACAFVCPACTCFDIQDEIDGDVGIRHRSWDSCKFHHFTLHTSGHNPRPTNNQRWRQRLMHKFSYEPERLNVLGCVGCGRCSRACPTDMNILDHLLEINGAV